MTDGSSARDQWREDVRARARPPKRPPSRWRWPAAVVALLVVVFGWGLASGVSPPFSSRIDNVADDWLPVHVFGGDRTLVLADGSRWEVEVADEDAVFDPWETATVAHAPGALPGGAFFADIRMTGKKTAEIVLHREMVLFETRTWNPLRETADRCIEAGRFQGRVRSPGTWPPGRPR